MSKVLNSNVKSLNKYFEGSKVLSLPRVYVNEQGNFCYDIENDLIDVYSFKEFNEYKNAYEQVYDLIKDKYKTGISNLYKSKLNLLYGRANSVGNLWQKIANSKSKRTKTINVDELEKFAPNSDSVAQDKLSFGYVVSSLKKRKFKPYSKIRQLMGESSKAKEEYLFPEFTDNGIKVNLNGDNLVSEFRFVDADSALALKNYLFESINQIDNGKFAGKTEVYEALINKLFENSALAAERLKSKMVSRDGSENYVSVKQSLRQMEKISQLLFEPDLTKFIKKKKSNLDFHDILGDDKISSEKLETTDFETQDGELKELNGNDSANQYNGSDSEKEKIKKVVVSGEYSSKPEIRDGRLVVVITPTGEEYFTFEHKNDELELRVAANEDQIQKQ